MKVITYKQIREIISRSTTLQNDLMELGLIETNYKMHEVVRQIGWEVASIVEGNHPVTKLPTNASQEI